MAVYNGGFPASYQQYYPQYQTYQPQVQQQTSGPIWIQGEAAAKSYLVAPGTTVALWDSESQTIYLKSADASGMPSIKTLDYTIRDLNAQKGPRTDFDNSTGVLSSYATKTELEALKRELEALQAKLAGKEEKDESFV